MGIEYMLQTIIRGKNELRKVLDDLEKLETLSFLRDSHKERIINISLNGREQLRKDQKYKVFDTEYRTSTPGEDPISIVRKFKIVNEKLAQFEYHEWNSKSNKIQNTERYDPPKELD